MILKYGIKQKYLNIVKLILSFQYKKENEMFEVLNRSNQRKITSHLKIQVSTYVCAQDLGQGAMSFNQGMILMQIMG